MGEFSSENLCFATEYSQFRESLKFAEKENFSFHTILSETSSDFKIEETTLDKMTQEEFMDIVQKLYHKYIEPDTAVYEINISYPERLALASILDDRSRYTDCCTVQLPKDNLKEAMEIIMPILEDILMEISKLLQSSYLNFRQTNDGRELCILLNKKEKKLQPNDSKTL